MTRLSRILPALEGIEIDPDAFTRLVKICGRKTVSPDEARAIAVELLYAADEAEDDSDLEGFGYCARDSRSLGELRTLIDDCLGWEDDEQEVDGDYEARVRQVGQILKRGHLQLVKP